MAKASDERLANVRGRRAGRHSARHQGPVRHRRRPHPGLQPYTRRLQAALRINGHRQSLGRRRGDARQAQHGRVRHGLVQRDILLRPGDQSMAAFARRPPSCGRHPYGRRGLRLRRWCPHRHARSTTCSWCPAARPAARRQRSRPSFAPAPRRPIPAARSASRPLSPARSASSRPTAASRAGASSHSRRRSTRPDRSPATCAMPPSC